MLSRVHEVLAPSNIALIKYWGKRDAALQIPANDSLSMTLATAFTCTRAAVAESPSLTSAHGALGSKAERHLAFLKAELGFDAPLAITTKNSFPAACGIASSASGLAALTIAAIAAWTGASSFDELAVAGFSRARLANLARRGSGSACRSLYGGYVQWHADTQDVSVTLPPDHWQLADIIVVLSDAPKAVSSTDAHAGAWASPLFAPRLAGLPERLAQVRGALVKRDLAALGDAIEIEALEMHAVMMSGQPAANYFTASTSRFLCWLREERRAGRLAAWFTIDAGPNVHLICEAADSEHISKAVELAFPEARLIRDHTGHGPTLRTLATEDVR